MNELESALRALCDELELAIPPADDRGRFELRIDTLVLRVGPWGGRDVVLEGIVGSIGANAAREWENRQELLRQVLTTNLARLKGRARPEVLSFDEDENVLLLWRTWPADERLPRHLLQGAEEMLNELEFWHGMLAQLSPSFQSKGTT